jgi:DNA-binding transcriptional LysR family regulator
MLSVWRLQLLREVSRRGTIKAAAGAMSLTPPAVSQQLAILERETGVDLLEKSGRRVRLTVAGQLLVQHADTITGAIAAAEADLASLQQTMTGTLRVAAFPTAARAVMPAVMTALSHRHPGLRVTLQDLEANESFSALRMDEIDIAIVDEYDEETQVADGGLEVRDFLYDPLFLVLPLDQRPSSAVSLPQVRDAFWIMARQSSEFCRVTVSACRAAGFEPRIRSHCKDFSVIIALVEAGLGVSILSSLALYDRSIRARVFPTIPPLARRIAAVIRPERRMHPALALMMAELDRFGASYEPALSTPGLT